MSPYQYIKRALAIIVAIIVIGLIVRPFLVPESFGQYGVYRGAHLEEARVRDPVHSGDETCSECHDDNYELKGKGSHASVPCETCHFQPYAGNEKYPDAHPEVANAPDRSRDACTICHEYLPSRPVNFPQIKNFNNHISGNWSKVANAKGEEPGPDVICIACHDPHSPKIVLEDRRS